MVRQIIDLRLVFGQERLQSFVQVFGSMLRCSNRSFWSLAVWSSSFRLWFMSARSVYTSIRLALVAACSFFPVDRNPLSFRSEASCVSIVVMSVLSSFGSEHLWYESRTPFGSQFLDHGLELLAIPCRPNALFVVGDGIGDTCHHVVVQCLFEFGLRLGHQMVLQIIDMRLVFGNELLQSFVLVFVSVELGSCQLALYIHPSG
jgi:hypothetical protein